MLYGDIQFFDIIIFAAIAAFSVAKRKDSARSAVRSMIGSR